MLEDQLAIITGMWKHDGDAPFDHDGRGHSVKGAPGTPEAGTTRPVERRAADRHGRVGEEAHPAPRGDVRRRVQPAVLTAGQRRWSSSPTFATRVKAAGRAVETMTFSCAVTVVCGKDEAEFTRGPRTSARTRRTCARSNSAARRRRSPSRAGEYEAAGAQRLYLQVLDLSDLDHIHLIAETLKP